MFSSNTTQVSSDAAYIEDVFSTWLYDGNSSTQTITNGIDLAGKGGLVWSKSRNTSGANNVLVDTVRGFNSEIFSNLASPANTFGSDYTAWNANGYSLGFVNGNQNLSGRTYVSWTFREQPKFFDVVTYTGNGANRTIAHSLGSVPGCIIVKRTNASADWQVYHRVYGASNFFVLNSAAFVGTDSTVWNNTEPTSTQFSVGTNSNVNASGGTYVAYIFAHNAGGFGAAGTDNVITCGFYRGNELTAGPVVDLGYEPQWLLIKAAAPDIGESLDWNLIDNMRGFVVGGTDAELNPNLSAAESAGTFVTPTATGFQINTTNRSYNAQNVIYIYIAIRRGPMRTPTSGTSVFAMDTYRATSPALQSGFVVDMFFNRSKSSSGNWDQGARLIGANYLRFNTTNAEAIVPDYTYDYQNGVRLSGGTAFPDFQGWMLRRAPGFLDVVCYTGNGVAGRTVNHNLGVAPELMIVKRRNDIEMWPVYAAPLGATKYLILNTQDRDTIDPIWNNTSPTSSVFSLWTYDAINASGSTYVAYLFASAPGVSKVGSFTGTGATQTIDCGFAAGARFVLIKRTDAAGGWYVWDSARGIVAGNDPYLLLNSTAAEVTNTDWVDTAASGFELSNAGGNLVNINGASYIFLSVA